MLFIIPGFPFITSGIDLAKLDMRSGMERLMYSLIIITVATMTAWILAMVLGLKPMPFLPLKFALWQWIILRLLASFGGVFGFSILFNSPIRLAAAAGVIGAVSNTFRLELIDLASFPPAVAAFARCFCCRHLRHYGKRSCRISKNIDHGPFYRDHGTGTLFIQRIL